MNDIDRIHRVYGRKNDEDNTKKKKKKTTTTATATATTAAETETDLHGCPIGDVAIVGRR